jgi:hypothetical protein
MSLHSCSPRLTVEEIAAIRKHYLNICEEQSEVFRTDLSECLRAFESYVETDGVAKAGQSWMPSDTDRNAYILEMEERCKLTPTSFDE